MAATFCNNGLDPILKILLNNTAQANWVLHLFTDAGVTPAVTDTTVSRTECALSGYAAVTLTGASWTGSATAGVATDVFPATTFTFSSYAGGTTIYGYYCTITISATTYFICEEVFASSYAVPSVGGSLVVNLTSTLQKH